MFHRQSLGTVLAVVLLSGASLWFSGSFPSPGGTQAAVAVYDSLAGGGPGRWSSAP